MKKLLKKKPVMISLVVFAIIMIAVYVGMLVRPVSYGFNYVYKEKSENSSFTVKYNFKSDKVLRLTEHAKEGEEEGKVVTDMWIYRDGDTAYVIGTKKYVKSTELTDKELEEHNNNDFLITTKAEYEVAIEKIEKAKAEGENSYKIALGLNTKGKVEGIGLFKIQEGEDEPILKNTQAIVFTVVHGVVTVVVVAFAVTSVVLSLKKGKTANKKKTK